MSRVSHLRSLFEEKVRQANEERERAKGQLNNPTRGNLRRDNNNAENLFDPNVRGSESSARVNK